MNTPQWQADKDKVLARHPTARCVFDAENSSFRICELEGDRFVALSHPWDTETTAWHEAAGVGNRKVPT